MLELFWWSIWSDVDLRFVEENPSIPIFLGWVFLRSILPSVKSSSAGVHFEVPEVTAPFATAMNLCWVRGQNHVIEKIEKKLMDWSRVNSDQIALDRIGLTILDPLRSPTCGPHISISDIIWQCPMDIVVHFMNIYSLKWVCSQYIEHC